jgi:Secretion system C-terminal sorting domain
MKKIVLLISFVITSLATNAQTLPDGMETWRNYFAKNFFTGTNITSVPLENASGWTGSDSIFIAFGKTFNATGVYKKQVSKTTGHGGSFAMRISNVLQDSIPGFVPYGIQSGISTNGIFGLDSNQIPMITGGWNFSNLLKSISFWVKTDIKGNDASFFTARLIDDADGIDVLLGLADTTFATSINGWTKVTLPFVWTDSTINPTKLNIIMGGIADSNASLTDTTSITIDDIEVNFFTGVSSLIYNNKAISLFPNPTSDYLYVDVPSEVNCDLHITNAQGQIVMKHSIGRRQKLNVSTLADGQYQCALYNKNRELISSQKLQIRH